MIDYQKILDQIAAVHFTIKDGRTFSEDLPELLDLHLRLQRLAVLIEQRDNLGQIAEQLRFLRIEINEKLDSFIAERIESDKVATSLLKELNFYNPFN